MLICLFFKWFETFLEGGLPVPFHGQGQYSHQVGMSLTPGLTPNNSGISCLKPKSLYYLNTTPPSHLPPPPKKKKHPVQLIPVEVLDQYVSISMFCQLLVFTFVYIFTG